MGQGTLRLSLLVIDGWFTSQASWSPARYEETSVRSVPGGRAPGPSRAGFLYIKSGASSSLQQWRSKQRWQRSFPPVAAPLGQRALSFTESPEDFPPGP